MAELSFIVTADTSSLKREVDKARRKLLGLTSDISRETKTIDNSFRNLGIGLAGYFSANALMGFTQQLINVRGEFQKTEIAFETMLGSGDKAKELMSQMVDLAAKTPFSLQDVASGAKQLLAFQVPANEVVDTLTRMGNIAAGLSVPLSRINLVFGQVKAKGKLAGDDLRQFTEAGIPMLAELAKKFDTNTGAISEMVSAGKIGFNDVKDVLFSMTNEGGMFFNLMEKQSASLSGKVSNLSDAFDQMLNKIGESQEGLLAGGIDALSYLVENYEDVGKAIISLIALYGEYRAVLLVTSALQAKSATPAIIQGLSNLTKLIRGTTIAQKELNAATLANPYVLAATAIGAMATAIFYFSTGSKEAKETAEQLNSQLEFQQKLSESTARAFEDGGGKIIASVNKEIAVLKSSHSTLEMREKAYKSLVSLNKSFVGTVDAEFKATNQLNAAYKTLVDRLNEIAIAKGKSALLEELSREKAKSDLDIMMKGDAYEKQRLENQEKRLRNQKKNEGSYIVTGSGMGIGGSYNPNDTNERYDYSTYNPLKEAKKNGEKINKQFEYLTNDVAKSAAEAKKKGDKEIETALLGVSDSAGEKLSLGWADNLENQIKELEEKIKSAPTKQLAEKWAKKKAELQAELSSINPVKTKDAKAIQKKTFEEELAEVKRQISVRDKLLQEGYSQADVDKMFPNIKNLSFLQYLEKVRTELETNIAKNPTKQLAENFVHLKEVLDERIGKESFIDSVSKQIDELKSKFSGLQLIEELEKLNNSSSSTSGPITEENKSAREQATKKAQAEERERIKDHYDRILEEQRSFEERSLDIQKEYDKTKDTEEYKNGTDSDRAKVDSYYSKKLTDTFLEQVQSTGVFKDIFVDVNLVATKRLEEFKEILKKKLTEAKTEEEKIKIGEFIKKMDDTIRERNPYEAIKLAIKSLSDESITAEQKLVNFANGIDATNKYLNILESTVTNIEEAMSSLGISMDGVFSDILYNVKGTITGLKQGLEGFKEFKTEKKAYDDAVEKGDVFGKVLSSIGMVGAAVKVVSGVIKSVSGWLSGDKKKDREIKRQEQALKDLTNTYNELAFAAERAFGSQKYSSQFDLIKNLEQQKIALQAMIRQEDAKKKTDNDKIKDWQAQMQAIDQSIISIKDKIKEDFMQTDFRTLSAQLADALIDAFLKGEDAAKSLEKVTKDVFKNIVRQAIATKIEGFVSDWIDKVLAMSGLNSDGTGTFNLSTSQIKTLQEELMGIGQNAQALTEMLLTSIGMINGEGLASNLEGSIKGISEETGNVLAGQMNAMRIYQAEIASIHRNNQEVFRGQLLQLAQIEVNTRYLRLMYGLMQKKGSIRDSGISI